MQIDDNSLADLLVSYYMKSILNNCQIISIGDNPYNLYFSMYMILILFCLMHICFFYYF